MRRAFEGENVVRLADGSVFYPPEVDTGPKDTGPTCGRCGTPWHSHGCGRRDGYEFVSWQPRCFCWQDGKLTNAYAPRRLDPTTGWPDYERRTGPYLGPG